ncbi:5-formyltetrahydrofolate cyclo-ligase [Armatimonas rosea]|uniref:5-formyltetrahydrofolate cyclo-ligase n=1 Tax=Armatimonas rosea TaxID=685828 RepID=A0A7W9SS79_ARMRO|nr:5-formyltetrahydrofolate cyclo-ligase [Armatimonas rosea]MBB6051897.1 5-formyltetrahydrofolate cyclo-ligase [Armatimonas rosea]
MSKPTPSPASPKTEWRTWALEARRSLDRASLSAQLHRALLPALVDAQHVLLYAATAEEIDLLSLVAALPETQFYLPRCAPQRRLAVHAYPCPLVTSRFGIREPAADQPEADPFTLDLVLVPALVLDQRGYRLGYGGGYYDRFLPRLRPDCRTLGIAPFIVAELPTDPWDVPVGLLSGGG